ncbi:MAG: hypothetical protein J6Y37_03675 [Paludibacteraceae bacterium]|nr:hypothetical protein [Paludibacteraceae bacterium]
MRKGKIYAFAGRKRAGKTFLATHLVDKHGFHKLSMADNLKCLCANLLQCSVDELNSMKDDGTTFSITADERWISIISDDTDIPIHTLNGELLGMEFNSVRQILQVMGTDIIRKYKPTWHVDKTMDTLDTWVSWGWDVVVDDVRFIDEMKALKERGADVFFIVRTYFSDISNHESETSLRWQDFDDDHVLLNTLPKKHFVECFDSVLSDAQEPAYMKNTLTWKRWMKYNSSFGMERDELTDVVLKVIKNDSRFLEKGIITVHGKELCDRLNASFDKPYDIYHTVGDDFMCICNPLINENLKRWL